MEPTPVQQQNQNEKEITETSVETQVVEKELQQFVTQGLPPVIIKKIQGLVHILNQDVVNSEGVKKYLAQGIPDEAANIREFCWKLTLGYLPEEKSKWPATVQKQTQTYHSLVKMFLPQQRFQDYPLLLRKGHPRFQELEEDYLLWQQIEKDTSRTHAQFSFFAMPSSPFMIPFLTSARRQKFKLINGEDELPYKQFLANKEKQRKVYRYDYMTRILYIYAKLNPKIQYVQGMNEILAPIFYLVNVAKPAHAIEQASCFFMFNNAISEIIELHIKDFDKSKNGIHGKLNQVNQMLMAIEPSIWKRMQDLKIDPFFYCFRWITLLYAQDFPLFDTLRIWESIFSTNHRMRYTKFFAIAIIISCKQFILENQFTVVLEHLQDIQEHIVIRQVIALANSLVQQYQDQDFINLAEKGKKKVEKQWQKEREKRDKDEKVREKEDEKNRKKVEKQRIKQEKQKQKSEENQDEEKVEGQGKEQNVIMGVKVPKKVGGFFKKMGNMVDKFLN